MNRAHIAVVVLAGVVAGVVVAHLVSEPARPRRQLERATLFAEPRAAAGAFELVDQAGARSGRQRLRGHWTFLFFGFVNCPDVCPTTLATLAAVRKTLADLPEPTGPRSCW